MVIMVQSGLQMGEETLVSIYVWILLIFGVAPITLLWGAAPWVVRRYKGSLITIVVLISLVSIPWEILSVDRIWYYSLGAIWGPRLLNLPLEELAFFVVDGLLVGTIALLLGERYHGRH